MRFKIETQNEKIKCCAGWLRNFYCDKTQLFFGERINLIQFCWQLTEILLKSEILLKTEINLYLCPLWEKFMKKIVLKFDIFKFKIKPFKNSSFTCSSHVTKSWLKKIHFFLISFFSFSKSLILTSKTNCTIVNI